MTVFEQADYDQQVDYLRRLGKIALAQWGLDGQRADLRLLKYRENAVFAVTLDGERHALRIHRPGYHSLAALRSELQWMDAIQKSGIPVPRLIASQAGNLLETAVSPEIPDGRMVDLFAWIEGVMLETAVAQWHDQPHILKNLYDQVGELLAKLHNQAVAWTLPKGFVRHAWDAEGLTGENPFWGRFWEFDELNQSQKLLLLQARQRVHDDLLAFGKTPENYSLIHADLIPVNMMVDQHIVQVIDFDDAGFGWHLFDIATTLYFLRQEPFYDDIKQAMIAGYRRHRLLPDDQLAYLPLFMVARSFTYLGWLHDRPELMSELDNGAQMIQQCCTLSEAYLRR